MSWLDEMEARDPAYRGACEEGTTMTASTDYEARAEEAYAANAREEMIRVSRTHRRPQGLLELNYTAEDRARILTRVNQVAARYDLDETAARVWEVISRYEGDAGLSERGVRYLTSAVLEALKDD